MNFLKLDKSHIVDRIIPKEMLYENAELSEKEKNYFVESVERVKLYYTLSTENSNIASDVVNDCTYDEIIYIELKLRNLNNFERILKIIHSSIPKPLIITIKYENYIYISAAEKTNANNKIKILEVFTTSEITDISILDSMSYDKVVKGSLSVIYKYYIEFVKQQLAKEVINNSGVENKGISSSNVDEFLELQKELELLSEKMRKEDQLKKRVEISLEIKILKTKITDLLK